DRNSRSSILDPRSSGGHRLYRTGDLVRYLPDGSVEFIGRVDHQVKIRGFRIELGEIEVALAQCPGVRDALVIVREDLPGVKQLVAYIVQGSGVGDQGSETRDQENPIRDPRSLIPDLRSFLRQKLPDYMIPTAFVILAELPINPNGKIDVK